VQGVLVIVGAAILPIWLDDGLDCAAHKLPSGNNATARLEFDVTKLCWMTVA